MIHNLTPASKLIVLQILFLSFSLIGEAQNLPFKVLVVASPDPDHGAMIIPSQAMLEKIGTEYGFTVDFTRGASPMINKERHTSSPKFNVLVLAERGGDHEGFVVAALDWLDGFAAKNNFDFTVVNHASEINAKMLSKYKEIIQLNYAPYGWGDTAMSAFVKYIEQGRGGWVGFHHASLLGEFDGYPMWDWFSKFMGGIRFKNYIAAKASATVNIEDKTNPVMKGVPSSFTIPDDEWYTFNINPRPNVHVMATVDESTYKPMSDIKMGDHPVIWTNEKVKAKNIYFLIGHSPSLLKSEEFRTMFGNAILWAAE